MTSALRSKLTPLCDRLKAVMLARGTPVELATASLPITNLLHESGIGPRDFTGADRRLLAVASFALLIMPHTRPPIEPGSMGDRVLRELGMLAPPTHTDPKGISPVPEPIHPKENPMTLNVTPEDMARWRGAFAVASTIAGQALREVQEALPTVWREQVMPTLAGELDAAGETVLPPDLDEQLAEVNRTMRLMAEVRLF